VVGFVAVFHLKTGLPLSIISEACFNGDQPRPLRPLTKLYGIAPLVAFLLISLVFDYLILVPIL
jgi:hypothetical protein